MVFFLFDLSSDQAVIVWGMVKIVLLRIATYPEFRKSLWEIKGIALGIASAKSKNIIL